jgi:hypothetical protein
MIFVFGSNLAGRHGRGAALCAKNAHGAVYGVGVGRTGNAYAIPTKDERIRTLPLERIAPYVSAFLDYARANPDLEFEVTKIGCGLAGYSTKLGRCSQAHRCTTLNVATDELPPPGLVAI